MHLVGFIIRIFLRCPVGQLNDKLFNNFTLIPLLHGTIYVLLWEYLYRVWDKVDKCCFNPYRSTGKCSVTKLVRTLWRVTWAAQCAGAVTSRRFEWERLSGTQFVVFLTRCWFQAESSLVLIWRRTRYFRWHLLRLRGPCQVGTSWLLGIALQQDAEFCFLRCGFKYRIAW